MEKANPTKWIEKKLEYNNTRIGTIEVKYLKDVLNDRPLLLGTLPKTEYDSYIASEKKVLLTLTLQAMKKTILAHWKQFIKEDDDKKEARCI